ncbi:hypothetical protein [Leptothermofonsia sp. ETS-13]|uniref:hypothetical protein n=1 Tax=Leptothermofonsia sp. ETS-13 TaxID=3035696 RepID=UPI003B9F74CE
MRSRANQDFLPITAINFPWTSPTLGIRFELAEDGLMVFYPDGELFKNPDAFIEERDRIKEERDRAFARLRELVIDPEQL